MTNIPARGQFITFEGGEGSGKSTQCQILAARLRKLGLNVVTTREPGGTPTAESLRAIILAGDVAPHGAIAEALCFCAARIDHLDTLIIPSLNAGIWVICDRFADSTRAYQGAAGAVDLAIIDRLESVVVAQDKPNLTLMLDLPVENGLARANKRRHPTEAPDRFESENLDFHLTLRKSFLEIASKNSDRCVVIDASKTPENVSDSVWEAIASNLIENPPAE